MLRDKYHYLSFIDRDRECLCSCAFHYWDVWRSACHDIFNIHDIYIYISIRMHVLYSTVRPLDRNQLFSIIHAFIKNAQTKTTTTARRKGNGKGNSEKNREWKGRRSRSSALSCASFDVKWLVVNACFIFIYAVPNLLVALELELSSQLNECIAEAKIMARGEVNAIEGDRKKEKERKREWVRQSLSF